MADGPLVVLAGGGTGGHVYPALAMGEALVRQGARIHYLGDAGRLEGRVVPARGVPFTPVPAVAYPRAGLVARVGFAVGLGRAVLAARGLLRGLRPDFVLGVGGYISAPPVLAAWTMGVPRAVHEANVTPGLANRLCARVAQHVFLTYAETGPRLPGGAPQEVVGCPVHPGILQGDRAAALARYGFTGARPVVLVVGGSLGAQALNDLGLALARHPDRAFDLALVTGPRYFDATAAALGAPPPGVALLPYEDRMADAFAAADLVVCRAGSSTLAELCAVGKPSVLLPSPNVTDNHQEGNARGLERVGAAEVVLEKGMDPAATAARIAALAADPPALARMGAAARSQAVLDTADRVARRVLALVAHRG